MRSKVSPVRAGFTADSFARTGARIGTKAMMFETPGLESVDIDTPDDWDLASAVAAIKFKQTDEQTEAAE